MQDRNWQEKFLSWIRELCRYGKLHDMAQIFRAEDKIRLWLYTETHRYGFTAKKDYLGCIASCRKQRAGEDWTRGCDLPDGEFSRKTWDKIVRALISCELVKLQTDVVTPFPETNRKLAEEGVEGLSMAAAASDLRAALRMTPRVSQW